MCVATREIRRKQPGLINLLNSVHSVVWKHIWGVNSGELNMKLIEMLLALEGVIFHSY